MSNSILRRFGGVVAGLIALIFILALPRQLNLWSVTEDPYYIFSVGLYLTLVVISLAGTVWGFLKGDRADKVYGIVGTLFASGSFLVALYYWITGFVLGRDQISIYIALVMFFWGIVLFVVTAVIPRIAKKIGGVRASGTSS